MKKYVNSAEAWLPAATKIKKRWLFIIKHSKAVCIIACLFHNLQDVFLIFSEIELLNYLANLLAIVLNYCFEIFTFHYSAGLDDKVQLLS
jgi:hypothetical protein